MMKNIGFGTASASILGVGTSAAQEGTGKKDNTVESGSEIQSGDGDVEPDAMINATTKFSPYSISTGETSILQSVWEFQTVPPIPANYYQIDILVDSNHVSQPETVSQNVNPNDVTKEWEYRSSSPVGGAYHWQAKLWVGDALGSTAQVEAEVNPTSSGEVEARTGTFWPWQDWSFAFLDIS